MFSFFSTQPQNQIDKGLEALKWFHNRAASYPGYSYTFDSFQDAAAGGHAKVSNFLEGLGMAIESVSNYGFLNPNKVKDAMESLADKGAGKIPANPQAFFNALNDSAQDVSWLETGTYAAKETAKEVIKGAQAVGDTVITTAKTLNMILPILAVGAVIFIVVQKTKRIAG